MCDRINFDKRQFFHIMFQLIFMRAAADKYTSHITAIIKTINSQVLMKIIMEAFVLTIHRYYIIIYVAAINNLSYNYVAKTINFNWNCKLVTILSAISMIIKNWLVNKHNRRAIKCSTIKITNKIWHTIRSLLAKVFAF